MRVHTNDRIHRFQGRLYKLGEYDVSNFLIPHVRFAALGVFAALVLPTYLLIGVTSLIGIPGAPLIFDMAMAVLVRLNIREERYIEGPSVLAKAAWYGFAWWFIVDFLVMGGRDLHAALYNDPFFAAARTIALAAGATTVILDYIGDRGPKGVIEMWSREGASVYRHAVKSRQHPKPGTTSIMHKVVVRDLVTPER